MMATPRQAEKLVQSVRAASIEGEKKPKRTYRFFGKAKNLAWIPGRCLICGECYDMLTHVHAQKHGYETREDMIKDGKTEPTEFSSGLGNYAGRFGGE